MKVTEEEDCKEKKIEGQRRNTQNRIQTEMMMFMVWEWLSSTMSERLLRVVRRLNLGKYERDGTPRKKYANDYKKGETCLSQRKPESNANKFSQTQPRANSLGGHVVHIIPSHFVECCKHK
ncbi:hypothetical protein CBL_03939 [Carabus blaptoides fortunei]